MTGQGGVRLRVSVAVVRGQELLVVRRERSGQVTWVLPGGDPRPGEGIAACARREVVEETGLDVHPARIAFASETIDPTRHERTVELVFLAMVARGSGDPEPVEDGMRPCFVGLDTLGSLDLRPPIAGYLRGLRGSGLRGSGLSRTAPFLGNLWRDQALVAGGQATSRTDDDDEDAVVLSG
ncbi:MAG: NUDIX domain-containing protein [Actinomycetes bacterium]